MIKDSKHLAISNQFIFRMIKYQDIWYNEIWVIIKMIRKNKSENVENANRFWYYAKYKMI